MTDDLGWAYWTIKVQSSEWNEVWYYTDGLGNAMDLARKMRNDGKRATVEYDARIRFMIDKDGSEKEFKEPPYTNMTEHGKMWWKGEYNYSLNTQSLAANIYVR